MSNEAAYQKRLFSTIQRVKGDMIRIGAINKDVDSYSIFETYDNMTFKDSVSKKELPTYGYRTKLESSLRLSLCGPISESQTAYLELDQRYRFDTHELCFYRHEIWWRVDISRTKHSEHLSELMLLLRKSIRFDFSPEQNEGTHPIYHWHPSNTSELRLPGVEMTPIRVALFLLRLFDKKPFDIVKQLFSSEVKVVEDFYFRV